MRPHSDLTFSRALVDCHLQFLRRHGLPLAPGARVLDFGCGYGDGVEYLRSLGYDAYGVDTVAFWGDDFGQGVEEGRARVPEALARRLARLDTENYRLPFPDAHFDFAFSDQVFEHVHNPVEAMRELGRVLKPGAVSLHRFPGPNGLQEGHFLVPLTALCRFDAWLWLWALLGRRASWQKAMSAGATARENIAYIRTLRYAGKARLRQQAAAAGVAIAFHDAEDFRTRGIGGLSRLRDRAARLGLGAAARALLPLIAQRYMLLRRGGARRSAPIDRSGGITQSPPDRRD